jgi:hypothetical protein
MRVRVSVKWAPHVADMAGALRLQTSSKSEPRPATDLAVQQFGLKPSGQPGRDVLATPRVDLEK